MALSWEQFSQQIHYMNWKFSHTNSVVFWTESSQSAFKPSFCLHGIELCKIYMLLSTWNFQGLTPHSLLYPYRYFIQKNIVISASKIIFIIPQSLEFGLDRLLWRHLFHLWAISKLFKSYFKSFLTLFERISQQYCWCQGENLNIYILSLSIRTTVINCGHFRSKKIFFRFFYIFKAILDNEKV